MTLQRRVSPSISESFDPLAIAADLSRRFAETAADVDNSGETPRANFEALAEAGLLRLTIPDAAGGRGAGLETTCKVVEWIGRGEPSTGLILAMHLINHATVVRTWPAEIAMQLQQESFAGIALLNALRVEPELGTPARGGLPATVGRRTAKGWRISGHKLYSTGIPVLRWLLVWGRTDEAEPRVGTFLVPADAPASRSSRPGIISACGPPPATTSFLKTWRSRLSTRSTCARHQQAAVTPNTGPGPR